jgi:hypothetical protein
VRGQRDLFVFGIFFFVFREGAGLLFSGRFDVGQFLTSIEWYPTSQSQVRYGALALIVGYLLYRALPILSIDFLFNIPSRAMSRSLSPVMKGYLRAGAMICGAPAFDAEFGTADVLVLLEMEKLTARYKNHYAERAA